MFYKDSEQAAKWWRKAAEQGYAPAQYALGACYYNGGGVPKNLEKAEYWLRKSAAQGFEPAKQTLKNLGY